MPYKIIKNANKSTYRVVNLETGAIKAKSTTRKRAEAQIRLLNGLEHGMIPRGGK